MRTASQTFPLVIPFKSFQREPGPDSHIDSPADSQQEIIAAEKRAQRKRMVTDAARENMGKGPKPSGFPRINARANLICSKPSRDFEDPRFVSRDIRNESKPIGLPSDERHRPAISVVTSGGAGCHADLEATGILRDGLGVPSPGRRASMKTATPPLETVILFQKS